MSRFLLTVPAAALGVLLGALILVENPARLYGFAE